MRWTATTCERLMAIATYGEEQKLLLGKAMEQLSAAKETLRESVRAFEECVHEGRRTHGKDVPWPEELTSRIGGHQEDKERRERIVAEQEALRKRHAREVDRASERLSVVVLEQRNDDGSLPFDTKRSASSWRDVQLGDICEEKVAEAMSSQGILSVGQAVEAAAEGKMKLLLTSNILPTYIVTAAVRAVTAYTKMRDVESAIEEEEYDTLAKESEARAAELKKEQEEQKKREEAENALPTVATLEEARAWFLENSGGSVKCINGDASRVATCFPDAEAFYMPAAEPEPAAP